MSCIIQVCIPNTRRDFFDYEHETEVPCIGARVWVPFRNQKKIGVVVGHQQKNTTQKPLKTILERIDLTPLLAKDILDLCRWIAQYYQSPLSEVLALAIPKKYRQGLPATPPTTESYELLHPMEHVLNQIPLRAKKQRLLIHYLAQTTEPITSSQLKKQGFTVNQYQPLEEAGFIQRSVRVDIPQEVVRPKDSPNLRLNTEQEDAVRTILKQHNQYQCFLLYGITGSGKTEVYLQVIAHVLAEKKQILILVPEIGLTPQLLSRFTERFNTTIKVIHSHLNETERQIAWQQAKENLASIVIGTRAAVFTPMPQLGLIVIDEEHDASLKQMEGVRYSARDTALMRAHLAHIPIILGSATPSLESVYNCQQGKYTQIRLHHKALNTIPLHYRLVDLRSQSMQHGLAITTLHTIKKHLEQNNQVLVFINRRGFAPVVLCHHCGWMHDCPACDSHLTLHKKTNLMICHHCGLTQNPPKVCAHCHSTELIPLGIGTQRVDDYLRDYFPNTQVLRVDKDQTRKKQALTEHLNKIHQGEAQLIVGTQMLAKGHHFPKLSLVVILDADAGFYNQDFRATEQLGQLLTQVAGRAGRAEQAGEVLIQTHWPNNPLLNVLIQKGYDSFATLILQSRQKASLPPFHFLAVLRAQGPSSPAVLHLLQAVREDLFY